MFVNKSYMIYDLVDRFIISPVSPEQAETVFELPKDNTGTIREVSANSLTKSSSFKENEETRERMRSNSVAHLDKDRKKRLKIFKGYHKKKLQFPIRVFGFVGIQKFAKGYYLFCVKREKFVTRIHHTKIYLLERLRIIPLYTLHRPKKRNKKEEEEEGEEEDIPIDYYKGFVVFLEDKKYLRMTTYVIRTANHFYYTKTGNYDLTQSYQNQVGRSLDGLPPLPPDPLFFWNWLWVPPKWRNYLGEGLFVFLVQGSVCAFKDSSTGSSFTLVSRRHTVMSGTRYNCRGVDQQGYCSNFVESEEIITIDGDPPKTVSYLLFRGSIPLMWSQEVNMTYSPPVNLSKIESEASKEGFVNHFSRLLKKHDAKRILCVDLTKEKGDEGKLKAAYSKNCKEQFREEVEHVSFDIFAICGMVQFRFKRLRFLEELLKEKFSYEWMPLENGKSFCCSNGKVLSRQTEFLRVNCKEGLDRTNIVCTFAGKRFMESVLQSSNLMSSWEGLNILPEVNGEFKMCWGKNGDRISKFYAGSGALKTDRLKKDGVNPVTLFVNDAMKNILRYYQNNLNDGYKQDCIDLVLHKKENEKKEKEATNLTNEKKDSSSSPNKEEEKGCWFFGALFFLFLVFKPEARSEGKSRGVLGIARRSLVLFWIAIFLFVWKLSFVEGNRIVNKPKGSCKVEKKLELEEWKEKED